MMQKTLTSLVLESFGAQSYKKAMDCLTVLRAESVKVCVTSNVFVLYGSLMSLWPVKPVAPVSHVSRGKPCPHCSGADETAEHLMLHCTVHDQAQQGLLPNLYYQSDSRRLWSFLVVRERGGENLRGLLQKVFMGQMLFPSLYLWCQH